MEKAYLENEIIELENEIKELENLNTDNTLDVKKELNLAKGKLEILKRTIYR